MNNEITVEMLKNQLGLMENINQRLVLLDQLIVIRGTQIEATNSVIDGMAKQIMVNSYCIMEMMKILLSNEQADQIVKEAERKADELLKTKDEE